MQKKCLYIMAAVSLSACISAQALVPTENDPFQLSIPNLNGGLELNAEGMLAQPHGGDTGSEGNSVGGAAAAPSQANADIGVNPGVGYSIPNSGNDVHVQLNNTR